MNPLLQFVEAYTAGKIRVVDLTQTLSPEFPSISLPPEMGQAWPFRIEEVSRYDERGPAWYWNNFSCGEHTGTHFDAPVHWISGKDLPNNATDSIPPERFIGPAFVIDCSREAAQDPDFLLTRKFIEDWEAKHGRISPRSWVLMRTDWSKRQRPGRVPELRRRRPAHARARRRSGEVPGDRARRPRLRHRIDRHRCRAGLPPAAALPLPLLHARRGPLRPAVPDQPRSAAADRRGA